jgi:hypothetical protein
MVEGIMAEAQIKGIYALTRGILDNIPPSQKFNENDSRALLQAGPALMALENELVQGFYDTIQSHPPMAAIIAEGARGEREATLRRWWRRTLSGPFDEQYWAWQTLVGMQHVRVGVKNPMMMGMWHWVSHWLNQHARRGALGEPEAVQGVLDSFSRLMMTAQALTSESYLCSCLETLTRTTGFKPALLDRIARNEIEKMLGEARVELGAVAKAA